MSDAPFLDFSCLQHFKKLTPECLVGISADPSLPRDPGVPKNQGADNRNAFPPCSGARCLKSRCQQVRALSEGSRGGPFLPLPAPGGPRWPQVAPGVLELQLHLFSLCLCPYVAFPCVDDLIL